MLTGVRGGSHPDCLWRWRVCNRAHCKAQSECTERTDSHTPDKWGSDWLNWRLTCGKKLQPDGRSVLPFQADMARSKQLKRLETWHHRLIDWMLANPERSGREAATHFSVSPVWISIVKHSPVFRAEFERRREMISQAVTADLVGRATALAELSLDTLNERIERNRDSIPLGQVRDTAELMLRMLGYGGRGGGLSK